MVEDVLKELGIVFDGEFTKDGSYIVDLFDSDQFGKIYSLLDRNKDVDSLDESSTLTVHNANVVYLYGDYQLNLIADFDQDLYKLVVVEYEWVEDDFEGEEEKDERDN